VGNKRPENLETGVLLKYLGFTNVAGNFGNKTNAARIVKAVKADTILESIRFTKYTIARKYISRSGAFAFLGPFPGLNFCYNFIWIKCDSGLPLPT
jgi:hypothetical protein